MKKAYLIILSVTCLIFSCDNDEVSPSESTLTIDFSHVVDGSTLHLDQLIYSNAIGQNYSIKTVKYFVSGFVLYKTAGGEIVLPDIHYVDIREPGTLSYTFNDKIPSVSYSGISFVFGLAPEDNVTGRFADPPESLMEWPIPMGGGYHYMKLEGAFKTSNTESFFNFHSGMLNGTPYEIDVMLPNSGFTISGHQQNITLEMEIQNWFKNPNNWDFEYFGSAIMGNAEAQKTIQENGWNVFSIEIESL